MSKPFEKIQIIVHENNDMPFGYASTVGLKCTVNGQEEGLFCGYDKPTLTVAEVVEAVNVMLKNIIEKGLPRTDINEIKVRLYKEIFEDFERVLGDVYEQYVFDNRDIEGVEQDAIIAFADTMRKSFADFKKKYVDEDG